MHRGIGDTARMPTAPPPPAPPLVDADGVVLVGAGPAAAAAAVAMVREGVKVDRITAVDPAGRWFAAWDEQLARQAVTDLRSGWVFHPDPDPTALRRWLSSHGGIARAPGRTPTVDVFSGFVGHLLRRTGLLDRVVRGRVTSLDPEPGGQPGVQLEMEDGASYRSRAVVIAANPARPVQPHWARRATPEAPPVFHSTQIDLRAEDALAGRHVTIVGGGVTAGHLAVGAARGGADVTLLSRLPLRRQPFDVPDRWFRAGQAQRFDRTRTPGQRLEHIRQERRGTIPPWLAAQLDAPGGTGEPQLPDAAEAPLFGVPEAPQPLAGTITCRVGEIGSLLAGRVSTIEGDQWAADEVWLATGTRTVIDALPFVAPLRQQHPLEIHEGFPLLGAGLRWPGLPIWFTGAPTALELGPLAPNLAGARVAARTIAPQVKATLASG